MPSPVVDLNRAVAHSMAFGPDAGLRLVDEIADDALRNYAPLPAARGDFLFRAADWPRPAPSSRLQPSSPATRGKRPFSSPAQSLVTDSIDLCLKRRSAITKAAIGSRPNGDHTLV
jgi:hypothetical protein